MKCKTGTNDAGERIRPHRVNQQVLQVLGAFVLADRWAYYDMHFG